MKRTIAILILITVAAALMVFDVSCVVELLKNQYMYYGFWTMGGLITSVVVCTFLAGAAISGAVLIAKNIKKQP